jgi:pyridoxal/pyridoxine/pyridoxamine kinase
MKVTCNDTELCQILGLNGLKESATSAEQVKTTLASSGVKGVLVKQEGNEIIVKRVLLG